MKVSVIVPIYNVEEYLPACLNSLVHQGMQPEEYEIICIDDGSTDRSGDIAAAFAGQFDQIKLVRQKNSGLSAARNVGISVSCGEYLCFVDSDDYLKSNSLRRLYEAAIHYDLDKLMYDYVRIEEDLVCPQNVDTIEKQDWREEIIFFSNGVLMDEDRSVPEWKVAWNYLVRRSVLMQYSLRFNEKTRFFEDNDFNFWLSHCVGKCAYIRHELYYYRIRSGSLMHIFMNEDNFEKYIYGRLSLAVSYYRVLKEYQEGNPVKLRIPVTEQMIEDRMICEIQGVFSRLIRKGDRTRFEDILRIAKENGLYPYPMRLYRLGLWKKKKRMVINWITFLYPWEWYLRFCMTIRCGRRAGIHE